MGYTLTAVHQPRVRPWPLGSSLTEATSRPTLIEHSQPLTHHPSTHRCPSPVRRPDLLPNRPDPRAYPAAHPHKSGLIDQDHTPIVIYLLFFYTLYTHYCMFLASGRREDGVLVLLMFASWGFLPKSDGWARINWFAGCRTVWRWGMRAGFGERLKRLFGVSWVRGCGTEEYRWSLGLQDVRCTSSSHRNVEVEALKGIQHSRRALDSCY